LVNNVDELGLVYYALSNEVYTKTQGTDDDTNSRLLFFFSAPKHCRLIDASVSPKLAGKFRE